MPDPCLFVFVDEEGTSCVFVGDCDRKRAQVMIGRTLQSGKAPPLEMYCADEMAHAFLACNKTRPYDMMLTGEYEAGEELADLVGTIYEVTKHQNAVRVMPVDANGDVSPSEVWQWQAATFH